MFRIDNQAKGVRILMGEEARVRRVILDRLHPAGI